MKRLIVFLMTMLFAATVVAGKLYRYENDQGVMVIDDSVPPEMVHKGYDILSNNGRLLERVPRALTAEERAAKSIEDRQALDRIEQEKADKKLLTIFSSAQDAERARDRKIEALDVYINVTRGNILKLQNDFNSAQSQAAERERAGQAVPEFLVTNMDSLSRQITEAEASIAEKEKEKQVIRGEYAKDIERLRFLLQKRATAAQ